MSNFRKHIGNERGFTLVELIVTLAVIAIVASVAVMSLIPWYENYKAQERQYNAEIIYSSLQSGLSDLKAAGNSGAAETADLYKKYHEAVESEAGTTAAGSYATGKDAGLYVFSNATDAQKSVLTCVDNALDGKISKVGFQTITGSTGNYYCEINPLTGYVFCVFYSEDGMSYEKYLQASEHRSDSEADKTWRAENKVARYGDSVLGIFEASDIKTTVHVGYFEFDSTYKLTGWYGYQYQAEGSPEKPTYSLGELVTDSLPLESEIDDAPYGVLIKYGEGVTADSAAKMVDTTQVAATPLIVTDANGDYYYFFEIKDDASVQVQDAWHPVNGLSSANEELNYKVNADFAAQVVLSTGALPDGTASNPYQIRTQDQLQHIGSPIEPDYATSKANEQMYLKATCNYVQTHDVALDHDFTPIGLNRGDAENASAYLFNGKYYGGFSGSANVHDGAAFVPYANGKLNVSVPNHTESDYTFALSVREGFALDAICTGLYNASNASVNLYDSSGYDGVKVTWKHLAGIFCATSSGSLLDSVTIEAGSANAAPFAKLGAMTDNGSATSNTVGYAYGALVGLTCSGANVSYCAVTSVAGADMTLATPTADSSHANVTASTSALVAVAWTGSNITNAAVDIKANSTVSITDATADSAGCYGARFAGMVCGMGQASSVQRNINASVDGALVVKQTSANMINYTGGLLGLSGMTQGVKITANEGATVQVRGICASAVSSSMTLCLGGVVGCVGYSTNNYDIRFYNNGGDVQVQGSHGNTSGVARIGGVMGLSKLAQNASLEQTAGSFTVESTSGTSRIGGVVGLAGRAITGNVYSDIEGGTVSISAQDNGTSYGGLTLGHSNSYNIANVSAKVAGTANASVNVNTTKSAGYAGGTCGYLQLGVNNITCTVDDTATLNVSARNNGTAGDMYAGGVVGRTDTTYAQYNLALSANSNATLNVEANSAAGDTYAGGVAARLYTYNLNDDMVVLDGATCDVASGATVNINAINGSTAKIAYVGGIAGSYAFGRLKDTTNPTSVATAKNVRFTSSGTVSINANYAQAEGGSALRYGKTTYVGCAFGYAHGATESCTVTVNAGSTSIAASNVNGDGNVIAGGVIGFTDYRVEDPALTLNGSATMRVQVFNCASGAFAGGVLGRSDVSNATDPQTLNATSTLNGSSTLAVKVINPTKSSYAGGVIGQVRNNSASNPTLTIAASGTADIAVENSAVSSFAGGVLASAGSGAGLTVESPVCNVGAGTINVSAYGTNVGYAGGVFGSSDRAIEAPELSIGSGSAIVRANYTDDTSVGAGGYAGGVGGLLAGSQDNGVALQNAIAQVGSSGKLDVKTGCNTGNPYTGGMFGCISITNVSADETIAGLAMSIAEGGTLSVNQDTNNASASAYCGGIAGNTGFSLKTVDGEYVNPSAMVTLSNITLANSGTVSVTGPRIEDAEYDAQGNLVSATGVVKNSDVGGAIGLSNMQVENATVTNNSTLTLEGANGTDSGNAIVGGVVGHLGRSGQNIAYNNTGTTKIFGVGGQNPNYTGGTIGNYSGASNTVSGIEFNQTAGSLAVIALSHSTSNQAHAGGVFGRTAGDVQSATFTAEGGSTYIYSEAKDNRAYAAAVVARTDSTATNLLFKIPESADSTTQVKVCSFASTQSDAAGCVSHAQDKLYGGICVELGAGTVTIDAVGTTQNATSGAAIGYTEAGVEKNAEGVGVRVKNTGADLRVLGSSQATGNAANARLGGVIACTSGTNDVAGVEYVGAGEASKLTLGASEDSETCQSVGAGALIGYAGKVSDNFNSTASNYTISGARATFDDGATATIDTTGCSNNAFVGGLFGVLSASLPDEALLHIGNNSEVTLNANTTANAYAYAGGIAGYAYPTTFTQPRVEVGADADTTTGTELAIGKLNITTSSASTALKARAGAVVGMHTTSTKYDTASTTTNWEGTPVVVKGAKKVSGETVESKIIIDSPIHNSAICGDNDRVDATSNICGNEANHKNLTGSLDNVARNVQVDGRIYTGTDGEEDDKFIIAPDTVGPVFAGYFEIGTGDDAGLVTSYAGYALDTETASTRELYDMRTQNSIGATVYGVLASTSVASIWYDSLSVADKALYTEDSSSTYSITVGETTYECRLFKLNTAALGTSSDSKGISVGQWKVAYESLSVTMNVNQNFAAAVSTSDLGNTFQVRTADQLQHIGSALQSKSTSDAYCASQYTFYQTHSFAIDGTINNLRGFYPIGMSRYAYENGGTRYATCFTGKFYGGFAGDTADAVPATANLSAPSGNTGSFSIDLAAGFKFAAYTSMGGSQFWDQGSANYRKHFAAIFANPTGNATIAGVTINVTGDIDPFSALGIDTTDESSAYALLTAGNYYGQVKDIALTVKSGATATLATPAGIISKSVAVAPIIGIHSNNVSSIQSASNLTVTVEERATLTIDTSATQASGNTYAAGVVAESSHGTISGVSAEVDGTLNVTTGDTNGTAYAGGLIARNTLGLDGFSIALGERAVFYVNSATTVAQVSRAGGLVGESSGAINNSTFTAAGGSAMVHAKSTTSSSTAGLIAGYLGGTSAANDTATLTGGATAEVSSTWSGGASSASAASASGGLFGFTYNTNVTSPVLTVTEKSHMTIGNELINCYAGSIIGYYNRGTVTYGTDAAGAAAVNVTCTCGEGGAQDECSEYINLYSKRFEGGANDAVLDCNGGTANELTPTTRGFRLTNIYLDGMADRTEVGETTLLGYMHLYPKQKFTYTVSFDANAGEGSMGDQTFTYGTAQALSANEFTRAGYEFAGWNTESDGSGTSYDDQQQIDLALAQAANVTLYAQWTPVYKITLSGNGGAPDIVLYEKYKCGIYRDAECTQPVAALDESELPVRTDYKFAGFFANDDGTGTQYGGTEGQISFDKDTADTDNYDAFTQDTTIYAKWDEAFTLSLCNGTTSTSAWTLDGVEYSRVVDNGEASYAEGWNHAYSSKFTNSNVLDGWWADTNNDGAPDTKILNNNGSVVSGTVEGYTSDGKLALTESKKLYAKWKDSATNVFAKHYWLVLNAGYNEDTGEDDIAYQDFCNGDSADLVSTLVDYGYSVPADPSGNKRTLTGWFTARDAQGNVSGTKRVNANGSAASSSELRITADTVLYAQWQTGLTLVYAGNPGYKFTTTIANSGASSLSGLTDINSGNGYSKPSRTIGSTTYTLDGWYTSNTGNGATKVLNADGSVVSGSVTFSTGKIANGTLTLSADTTLYSRWSREVKIYKLTDSLSNGNTYLFVASNAAGSSTAAQPGSDASSTSVTINAAGITGLYDGNGNQVSVDSLYIAEDQSNSGWSYLEWKANATGNKFYIDNVGRGSSKYELYVVNSRDAIGYGSLDSRDENKWVYDNDNLKCAITTGWIVTRTTNYYVGMGNGTLSFNSTSVSSNKIYLYSYQGSYTEYTFADASYSLKLMNGSQAQTFADLTVLSSAPNGYVRPSDSSASDAFTLDGWYTTASGNGGTKVLNADGTPVQSSYTLTGDTTLYARWSRTRTVYVNTTSISSGSSYLVRGTDSGYLLSSNGLDSSVSITPSTATATMYQDSINGTQIAEGTKYISTQDASLIWVLSKTDSLLWEPSRYQLQGSTGQYLRIANVGSVTSGYLALGSDSQSGFYWKNNSRFVYDATGVRSSSYFVISNGSTFSSKLTDYDSSPDNSALELYKQTTVFELDYNTHS